MKRLFYALSIAVLMGAMATACDKEENDIHNNPADTTQDPGTPEEPRCYGTVTVGGDSLLVSDVINEKMGDNAKRVLVKFANRPDQYMVIMIFNYVEGTTMTPMFGIDSYGSASTPMENCQMTMSFEGEVCHMSLDGVYENAPVVMDYHGPITNLEAMNNNGMATMGQDSVALDYATLSTSDVGYLYSFSTNAHNAFFELITPFELRDGDYQIVDEDTPVADSSHVHFGVFHFNGNHPANAGACTGTAKVNIGDGKMNVTINVVNGSDTYKITYNGPLVYDMYY